MFKKIVLRTLGVGLLMALALGSVSCSSPAAAPASGGADPSGRSIKIYESPT